ncbi:hypothetical protein GS941_16750 [Rhodococcus hoagii]|nr:hypothetical protein [Prescottella equi]
MNPGERAWDLGVRGRLAVVRALPEGWAGGGCSTSRLIARPGAAARTSFVAICPVLSTTPAQVPDDLVRASLRSYARYWCEAFRLPTMDPVGWSRRSSRRPRGSATFTRRSSAGRGAVLALHHSGNWDMAGVWIARRVGPPVVVAERLRPESLYRRFVRFREGLGFEIIPLTGSAQPPFEQLTTHLRRGRAAGGSSASSPNAT